MDTLELPLLIALTFDADPDSFDRSIRVRRTPMANEPSWLGVSEGVPRLREALRAQSDSMTSRCKVTWFLRVDDYVAACFGSPLGVLDRFAPQWRECIDAGDELGWHAHLCRLTEQGWVQETDERQLAAMLKRLAASLASWGHGFSSTRIGEAYGSNAVMQTLDGLGFQCDSTAMPGRTRRDADRAFDWSVTPPHPYHPSPSDYRWPGDGALRLLELPMSMVRTQAEYDREPLLRYVDLSFRHQAIRDGLRAFLPGAEVLVAVTHPSTILRGVTDRRHGLLSFDLNEYERNLAFILDELDRIGREYRFVTVSQCAATWIARRTGQGQTQGDRV